VILEQNGGRSEPCGSRAARLAWAAALLLVAAGTAVAQQAQQAQHAPAAAYPGEKSVEILSDVFTVDRIFESMKGPMTNRYFQLPFQRPELVWLTGYSLQVVGADGATPYPITYTCHSNLDWDREAPPPPFLAEVRSRNNRAFTLSQGQTEIRLPRGFGVPIVSTEKFLFRTQVLNLNEPTGVRQVRHKARLALVRDADLERPMKPLFLVGAFVMASLEDQPAIFNVEEPTEEQLEASCHVSANASGDVYTDDHGRRFTGHWVVEPGRHTYRTLVTDQMQLPYDTTIHYIAVHAHPYSVSLELRDLSAGRTVYKSLQRNFSDRVGLERVDYYSGTDGLPLHADHEYELISVYDNPTDRPSDAMATMFLYCLARDWERPRFPE
jgi:hypothetical protein